MASEPTLEASPADRRSEWRHQYAVLDAALGAGLFAPAACMT